VLEVRRLEGFLRCAYSSVIEKGRQRRERKSGIILIHRASKETTTIIIERGEGMITVVNENNEMDWSRLRMRWKAEGEARRILKVFGFPPALHNNITIQDKVK